VSTQENARWLHARLELYQQAGRRNLFQAWRLAKKGLPHPDPHVDALVLRWAEDVLAGPPPPSGRPPSLGLALSSFLHEVVTLGFGGSSDFQLALYDRTDRRHAQRIIEVHRPC
jgi:hypothetical protein